MLEVLVHDYPLEDGDATCDSKLRVRLPSNWATYFLRREPQVPESAPLFLTTANRKDILIFHRSDYLAYRAELTARNESHLLECLRVWGGEAGLDAHGRFVMPPAIRRAFPEIAGKPLKVVSTLPVCLVPEEEYARRVAVLEPSQELHEKCVAIYREALPRQVRGGARGDMTLRG